MIVIVLHFNLSVAIPKLEIPKVENVLTCLIFQFQFFDFTSQTHAILWGVCILVRFIVHI